MHVHFKVEEESCRVYVNGNADSYANRETYDAVAQIKYCGDDTAYVYAAHGHFSIPVFRAILTHCETLGAKKVKWEHKNKDLTHES
jgi:hypothetical protein